jgi:hypothetical protein
MHSTFDKPEHSESKFVNVQDRSKTKSCSMWCCISANDDNDDQEDVSVKFNKIVLKD